MVEKNFEEEDILVLDEKTKDKELSGIVRFIEDNFKRSKDSRRFDEERWLQSYRNYRGIYSPDVQFTEAERSRIFIKITKTKVLAAYGQITDVLFARQKFPLSIEPTILPDGVTEYILILMIKQKSHNKEEKKKKNFLQVPMVFPVMEKTYCRETLLQV